MNGHRKDDNKGETFFGYFEFQHDTFIEICYIVATIISLAFAPFIAENLYCPLIN